MKRQKRTRHLYLLFGALMAFSLLFSPLTCKNVDAAGQVSKRISQVKKDFPGGSRINQWITVPGVISWRGAPMFELMRNGGCNALVTYTTMKVFHSPYISGSTRFKTIGTSKTTSTSAMKKLFKKAKKGDVIRWHKGTEDYHFAIFLSSGSNLVVYEANFGSKNKVWYNHAWPYSDMKKWAHGATQISVYRSDNYAKVNKGKAAKNLRKGAKFTYDGITYKVTKAAGLHKGTVKVLAKTPEAGKVPKAIGLNIDHANWLLSYAAKDEDDLAEKISGRIKIRTYTKDKGWYYDEQYFVVKK